MKRITLLATLALLLFTACGGKTVIDEEHTFDGDIWNRFTPEMFNFSVNNIDNYYNIDLTATVDTARFRYDVLPVMLILKAPGGEERQFYASVQLKGKAQATGRLRSYFSFNAKGAHHLEVSQATSQYDLEGIHSINLTVTRAKVDYDL